MAEFVIISWMTSAIVENACGFQEHVGALDDESVGLCAEVRAGRQQDRVAQGIPALSWRW